MELLPRSNPGVGSWKAIVSFTCSLAAATGIFRSYCFSEWQISLLFIIGSSAWFFAFFPSGIGPARKEEHDKEDSKETATSNDGDADTDAPSNSCKVAEEDNAGWVPPVRMDDESDLERFPSILTRAEMQDIAVHVLPLSISYCKWQRLHSLVRDGDSFDSFLRNVQEREHSLIVIRTSRNAVFGGFADAPWVSRSLPRDATYRGGPTSKLFRLNDHDSFKSDDRREGSEAALPSRCLQQWCWSGENRFMQLCDISRKRLAFGGGGDQGAFGLCVENDFQIGSTEACATFDSEPLCDQMNFDILDFEVYGFLVGRF